jgi:hypothetical protein
VAETILLLQRGGAVAAGSVQEIGVDDIVIGAAEVGVPEAAGRAGIIGTIVITSTVTVAAAATVGDVIIIIAAAGVQAGREMLVAAAA